jgi:LPS-assembly lipoprotein
MRWLSGALLFLGLLASSGCGFHPIYAKSSDATPVGTQMAQVKVDPIDYSGLQASKLFRLGQELHNALLARINPDGSPGKATYAIRVTLSEAESDVAVDPSGLSQRSSIVETASFKLVSLADGKQVMTGTSTGVNSFGNVSNAFATVEGREDARRRAIAYLASDIAARLALYFGRQPAEAKK